MLGEIPCPHCLTNRSNDHDLTCPAHPKQIEAAKESINLIPILLAMLAEMRAAREISVYRLRIMDDGRKPQLDELTMDTADRLSSALLDGKANIQ